MTGALAGENAVENNALSGDNARQPVKESAEWWKKQARDKLGKGTTSATANSIINAIADSGDTAIGSADYVADAAMTLASCATGNGYCPQASASQDGLHKAPVTPPEHGRIVAILQRAGEILYPLLHLFMIDMR